MEFNAAYAIDDQFMLQCGFTRMAQGFTMADLSLCADNNLCVNNYNDLFVFLANTGLPNVFTLPRCHQCLREGPVVADVVSYNMALGASSYCGHIVKTVDLFSKLLQVCPDFVFEGAFMYDVATTVLTQAFTCTSTPTSDQGPRLGRFDPLRVTLCGTARPGHAASTS